MMDSRNDSNSVATVGTLCVLVAEGCGKSCGTHLVTVGVFLYMRL